jgi:hypothetical protein
MAANFPTPAAPGEQWTDPATGFVWTWDGVKWLLTAGSGGGGGGGGVAGPPGPSAYEVAVTNGFVGTEAEWLASLEGEPGIQGPAGVDGVQGPAGVDGAAGPAGPAGPTAVSADAGNGSRLGSDGLLFTPLGLSSVTATAPLVNTGSADAPVLNLDLTVLPALP